jgi:hypothetical protein
MTAREATEMKSSNRFIMPFILLLMTLLLYSGISSRERNETEERVSKSPPEATTAEKRTAGPTEVTPSTTDSKDDQVTTSSETQWAEPVTVSPEAPNFYLDWWVVSSGGASTVASTSYRLGLTEGQTAYDRVASASYAIRMGFWQAFEAGSSTCCIPPTVGDCDQSGGVDITDVQILVDNQFLTLTPLVCEEEGDIDFSGVVDITDLQILIDNQFLTLTPLPPCP